MAYGQSSGWGFVRMPGELSSLRATATKRPGRPEKTAAHHLGIALVS